MKHIFSLLLFFTCQLLTAQDQKSAELSFEGQIAATTNGKGCFINFGGPGIKLKAKSFHFAINMLPSLRFQKEDPKPLITPILGVGPQFYFLKSKRLILSFPIYYYAPNHKWEFSAGIGYVLTQKKS